MQFKKRLSVMLIFAMILSSGLSISYAETDTQTSEGNTAAETGAAFTDIDGHWAEDIIKEAADLKIVGGYPDGTFRPDNLIKREEFYKLLTNILTVTPDTSDTKIQFTDVVENEWYVPTIKIAVASKITSGYGDGTFGIGLMISRQEAAKVAGSVIPSDADKSAKGAETALDKGSIADWAYDYVDLMFKKRYMKGDTEGNFRPTMALTRAEAATILLNVKKNETIIAANADELAGSNCLTVHSGEEGAFTAGKGTQSEPYKIYTEAQLNHMRMHTTEGAFYILEKN
ncbi:MAG TPA: S-layer homology domain-containing protein, partial [Anaerovoracaceae bacterium]|nr:S-layer homology domain-containing protein [Anaerovoracaceae bacterium]